MGTKKIIEGIGLLILGDKIFFTLLEKVDLFRKWFWRFTRFSKYRLGYYEFKYPLIKFGDTNYNYFFGYYDVSAINHDDSVLLALKAYSKNIPPSPDSFVQVGYFEIENPMTFHSIGETSTWCWQQGCRLQWYPLNEQGRSNTVIYNALVDGNYGCRIQNIQNRKILRQYQQPIYSVSPDGHFALFLNFSRLARLRSGYGYTNIFDSTRDKLAPEDDGIWYIDLTSGKDRLLLSIADIIQVKTLQTMQDAVHYFNHICINPDGSRFLFFHVWIQKGKRYTRLLTCNLDGSELYPLVNEGHVSHYVWKNSDEILCFSSHADTGMKYHLYRDKSPERVVIGNGLLNLDGHPSYSPDGQFILTDTYPDKYGDRHLLLIRPSNETITNLGGFYSPYRYQGEKRCDLHPRWSPSGRYIAFDSAHEGKRRIYLMDIEKLGFR